jgi:hypothetical protein
MSDIKEDPRGKYIQGSYTRSGKTFRPIDVYSAENRGEVSISPIRGEKKTYPWNKHYTGNSKTQLRPMKYCIFCNSHSCTEGKGDKNINDTKRNTIIRDLRAEIKDLQ